MRMGISVGDGGIGVNVASTTRAAARRRWAAAPTLLSARPGRYLLGVAALVAAYAGAAQLSYQLEFAGPVAAIVWLPVGVGIAFLYLGGIALVPGVLIGDLLSNDYSALPLGSAIGQTAGNVLEVVVAALLLRALVRRGSPLDSIGGLARMLAALATGTAISATVGTLSLWAGDVVARGSVPAVWRTWWLGDLTGALVVVPLVLAWHRPRVAPLRGRRAVEGALLVATVGLLSDLASRTHEPFIYLVFPALIWAALRFGRRGATLAVAIAVGVTVWNTTHLFGPFMSQSLTRSVLTTQLFIGVAAGSTLLLAAMVAERERFIREVAASRARLVQAGHTERRRLEQDLHDGAQQRLIWLAVDLRRIAAKARTRPAEVPAMLDHAEAELVVALEELRDLAHGIHPTTLRELGLAKAIRAVALRSTVPIAIGELPPARLDPTTETTAYYVFAEAVANAQKHSRAGSIRVSATARDGVLGLDVADDGIGGAAATSPGLQGLRDRVEGIGGSFALHSPPGGGTRITARIPLAPPRDPGEPD